MSDMLPRPSLPQEAPAPPPACARVSAGVRGSRPGRGDAIGPGAATGPEARRTMTKHDISGGPHDKT